MKVKNQRTLLQTTSSINVRHKVQSATALPQRPVLQICIPCSQFAESVLQDTKNLQLWLLLKPLAIQRRFILTIVTVSTAFINAVISALETQLDELSEHRAEPNVSQKTLNQVKSRLVRKWSEN